MKFRQIRTLVFLLVCIPFLAQAQTGTLRGKVTSGENGEALLGATIRVFQDGTAKGGAYTDIEGAYTVKVPSGMYDIVTSYISYETDTIAGVEITSGNVTVQEVLLYESRAIREDLAVEIVAKQNKASTVTLYNVKRTSLNTIDGISRDLMQRAGDNNVAGAMQRVTGVTVEDGKYVYVRGLGDRYSLTLLNGAVIPSLDPNRNAVQLDIFPSQLIDNIAVYKTFTPDLPGNFSGGLVNVITKDFPDRLTLNFSASLGYNTNASLRDDFLSYETGSKDWLAYDDGTRALPAFIAGLPNGVPERTFNDKEVALQIDQASKSFETGMDVVNDANSFLNQNYQFSFGNQNLLFGRPFGYIASLSYRNSYNAYDAGRIARWRNTSSAPDGFIADRLNAEREHRDMRGDQNVLWGGLAKISYKPFDSHKISFNYMRNQSGNTYSRMLEGPIPLDAADLIFQTRALGYQERSLNIYQIQGDHAFGNLKANWITSWTKAEQDEPDLRFFSNDYVEGPDGTLNYDLQPNLYAEPTRFYRQLSEDNFDARVNFELPFLAWNEQQGKVKFGGAFTSKSREFSEQRYLYSQGSAAGKYQGSPDDYLSDGNLGVRFDTVSFNGQQFIQFNYRNFLEDVTEKRNTYFGDQEILASYFTLELPITKKIQMVAGARFETTDVTVTSLDTRIDTGRLDLEDILPGVSFKYSVLDNMNVRAGYSRTLARPTFREFSPFVSFNFSGDNFDIGNSGLTRTLIDNYDVRWEWYPTPSELVSVSGFFKKFTDPIEKVFDPRAPNRNEITWENVPEAEAYGIEIEVRKNLGFLSPALSSFQVGGNASFLQSQVDIPEDALKFMRDLDPTRESRRQLYGQSPYAVNAELAYISDDSLGLKVSLTYNVFGPRIAVVGLNAPDVFEQPRGLLNLFISKRLVKGFTVTARANNLLDPEFKLVQTYRGEDYIFSNFTRGRSFSLGVSYSLQ